jgi:antirestriction protein ArdC
MTNSIYQQITETIIGDLLTAKPQSWERPWHKGRSSLPVNAATRRAYQGINILTLWAAAIKAGYTDQRWATYRQWSDLGAQVRKGEKGSLCIFYKPSGDTGGDHASSAPEDATMAERPRFVLRVSTLFNVAQVEGAPEPWLAPAAVSDIPACSTFDDFIAATGANIRHGGDTACYLPAADQICIPARQSFQTLEGYTATLSHELIHWTGARHRLDRDLSGRFGSASYAAEELVAELGAAFVLAGLGLVSEPPPQHAAYIISWLPLVKFDPRALFTAAAHASRAADWLREPASVQPPGIHREERASRSAQPPNC